MQNDDSSSPLLSVVLVTPDSYATVRRTIKSLAAQTVKDRLELVLVAKSAETLGLRAGELEGFGRFQLVELGSSPTKAGGNAAGVRRASALLVALAEDHCFPDPHWAEALIEAHRGRWAAVGPVVYNANPGNAVSWADLLIGYGPWTDPVEGGPATFLPGHNSSYKRAALLAYGNDLERLLEAEAGMHWDMRAKGHELLLDPNAKVYHLNFARLGVFTRVQFLCGRVFAAGRAVGWSPGKRMLYTIASPLIPFVRLRRILRKVMRADRPVSRWAILLATVYGLAIDGVGQLLGYALGFGGSLEQFDQHEFHRYRYIRAADIKAFAPLPDAVGGA